MIGPHPEFIQSPTVIAAEAFEEIVSKPAILARPIGQFMAGKFVQAVRNKHVLVNVKWRFDPLRKNVYDIGVSVGAIVEIGVESALPFLRLHDVVGVGRVKNGSLELQLAHTLDPGSDFKS